MTATQHDRAQAWLTGHYAPVADERDDHELEVDGELPTGLRGSFLRNGPNPKFAPIHDYHLFDGDGMVHAVTFDGEGGARYANRWVRNPGLDAEEQAGRALFGGLADFRFPPDDVFAAVGPVKNTSNTHVVSHAGHILTLMEGLGPIEITSDLETVGAFDFGGALTGSMTAHPKTDPVTGELVFFGASPMAPYLRVHGADPNGTITWSTVVELPGPVMMHDFAVTATRVVVFDLPAVFDLHALVGGGTGIYWDPSRGARVGVLERGAPGSDIRWIEVDPFWVFHFLNGHDEADGTITVTGCRAPRLNTSFGDEPPAEPSRPTLHRWRIDVEAGTVADEQLDDRPTDFPRLADARACLPNRFGYTGHTSSWSQDEAIFDGVTKYDLATGSSAHHTYGPGIACGEHVFASDPAGQAEDDGWLLTHVYDLADGTSAVAVVDASTLEEVARVRMRRRVPFGFHGSFLPDAT